eukprot:jgi/Chlat1/1663/Chrsp127S01908
MGVEQSKAAFADHQWLLQKFVGSQPVELHATFWKELTAFSTPLTSLNPSEVEDVLRDACCQLVVNNPRTGHLGKFLIHVISMIRAATTAKGDVNLATVNSVFLSRVFLKHLCEQLDHGDIENFINLHTFNDSAPDLEEPRNLIHNLVKTTLEFIIKAPVHKGTYLLHVEVMNLMLVLSSTQLYSTPPACHPFLESAMSQADLAPAVIEKLLKHYISREKPPPRMPLYSIPYTPGIIGRVASVFLLPYYTYSYFTTPQQPQVKQLPLSPLADTSLLLLLVLTHYSFSGQNAASEGEPASQPGTTIDRNPFRKTLETFRDTDEGTDPEKHAQGAPGSFQLSYLALFEKLGQCLIDDRSTLLFYVLIHGNRAFLDYVLARGDLDTLVMPLLEMLYSARGRTANQIYMLLIVCLILSQDASFNANIHKLMLNSVPWYKERQLSRISLGSLMVVVLIRTVKFNLSQLKDVYLHTNCLAALANMAPHVQQLNAYAAQRLVSLFYMLSRKYQRLQERDGSNAVEATSTGDAPPTELHIYTDFLRIVLEIINAILTYALPRNPELVYALLHRQEVFEPFRNHPRFSELLSNIYTVLDFFNVRMEDAKLKGEWSVEKVLDVVIANTRSWRGEGMKTFTELRFTYEEEMHPEEFFIPYVWSLVCAYSGVAWDANNVTLLPQTEPERAEFDPDLEDSKEPSPTAVARPGVNTV